VITVVGLGPGDPESVPAAALAAVARADRLLAPPLGAALAGALGRAAEPLPPLDELPDGAVLAAPDPEAHRLAVALPGAATVPARDRLRARAIGAGVAALAGVGERLRRDCPWDREQTAATIVPHTVEEVFEVAEAVAAGDPAHLADELGDLLFQSVFLARLLEEQDGPDLGRIARDQADKLVARHPHVYGDAAARDAQGVVDLWERRKREERADQGIFHDLPAGLPSLAYATKAQRRAAAVGFAFADVAGAMEALREEVEELGADPSASELGDVLFALVAVAGQLRADPELALRGAALRFRARVESAASLAGAAGEDFAALGPEAQLAWYERAHRAEPDGPPEAGLGAPGGG
jgi:MazG family protein